MPDGREALKDWLLERHDAVMAAERQAIEMLDKGDTQAYLEKMREKAQLLSSLYKDAKLAGVLAGLPASLSESVDAALQRFSSSAATALSLNSPFYMSALLYPDEHIPGDPDNLALFIQAL